MEITNTDHLAEVAWSDCQEVMASKVTHVKILNIKIIAEAVFLYVFIIAFTASLF